MSAALESVRELIRHDAERLICFHGGEVLQPRPLLEALLARYEAV